MIIKLSTFSFYVAVSILLLLTFIGNEAHAVYNIDKLITETEDKIKTWHTFYWLSLVSILMVGLLGLIIPLLQTIDQTKFKIHTICLGAVISACTFVTNSFLKGDYRQYDRIESMAVIKQQELHNLADIYKASTDEASKDKLWNDIKVLYSEITSLEESLLVSKASSIASLEPKELFFINSAFAADAPSWVTSLPEDDNYLYFIGLAESKTLIGLDKEAKKNAMESAKSFMLEKFSGDTQGKIDPDKLAKFLSSYAKTFSSYIKIDALDKLYRYYCLIVISKNTLKTSAELFSIENNVAIPNELLESIDASKRERNDYTAKQTKLYEQQEDQVKKQLSDTAYLNYLKARQLRKEEKKYPEAISLLEPIVQEMPDFYLGWYNLALAYDSSNDINKAKEIYQKAITLETKLKARDASIYNSYGHFFYKQEKYQDAIAQFEIALKLDPSNPRAKNNILQAKNKLLSP